MMHKFTNHKVGNGKNVVEMYLDYVCPFSKKMFMTMVNDLWKQNLNTEFVFLHQIQPWHPQSTMLHEAALAVSVIAPEKFIPFSTLLFEKQEDYFDDKTFDKTRTQIYESLASLASQVGVESAMLMDLLRLDVSAGKNSGNRVVNELKYFIKLGRARHIHASPTVIVNGLEDSSISSGWTSEQWKVYLAKL